MKLHARSSVRQIARDTRLFIHYICQMLRGVAPASILILVLGIMSLALSNCLRNDHHVLQ
jgi:hypothetical protein